MAAGTITLNIKVINDFFASYKQKITNKLKKMGSIEEKMKLLPRIKVDAKQEFIVETTIDGITICECIVMVKQISFNVINKSSKIIMSVYNPKSEIKEINNYEV